MDAFRQFAMTNGEVDFLFVNDGSSDVTGNMLVQLCKDIPQFTFLDKGLNRGKAAAIREGVLSLKDSDAYDYIGYFDADLATPLSEIPYFLAEIEKRTPRPVFVMGARIARLGAKIERKARRHYFGRVFATFASNVLKLPVYDTQCGAKLIHSAVVFDLFKDPLITKWLFDVELIARLKKKIGLQRVKEQVLEIPLNEWRDVAGSKLRIKDFLKAPFELLKIWKTY